MPMKFDQLIFTAAFGIGYASFQPIYRHCREARSAQTQTEKDEQPDQYSISKHKEIEKAVVDGRNEKTIIPLWFIWKGSAANAKILPPHFSPNKLFQYCSIRVQTTYHLSRSNFYALIYIELHTHIRFSKRQKNWCGIFASWNEIFRRLKLRSDTVSGVWYIVAEMLEEDL